MALIQNVTSKVKTLVSEQKQYWNTPKPGYHVPYKEWWATIFAVGGEESMGHARGAISFGVGCFLIGFVYQLPPLWFAMSGLIQSPLGYIYALAGNLVAADNKGFLSRKLARKLNFLYVPLFLIGLALLFLVPTSSMSSILPGFWKIIGTNFVCTAWGSWRGVFWNRLLLEKLGRFKPWAYVNLPQTVICLGLILYFPFMRYSMDNRFWILNLIFAIYGMYSGGVFQANPIVSNISPNPEERVRIMAWPGTLANGVNSVWGFFLPAMAAFTNGRNTLEYYRYIIPIGLISGGILYYAFLGKIKERVHQPKMAYKPPITFWTGADAVMRNKYKWISMISGLVDNFGESGVNITTFMFLYVLRETDWIFAVLNTLLMTAYTPGILLSPLFHKIEFRKLYFLSRTISIVVGLVGIIAVLLKLTDPIVFAVVVLVANWLGIMISQTMNVVNNNMGTNLAEYQMWISGERMDGFSGIFGWFTSPIGTMMGFMMPFILLGLGYKGDQSVLYIDDVRTSVILAGAGFKLIGDVASMIPQLWFKYTKKQHDQINADLAWRVQAAEDLELVNEAANHGKDAEKVLQEVIAMRAAREAEQPDPA